MILQTQLCSQEPVHSAAFLKSFAHMFQQPRFDIGHSPYFLQDGVFNKVMFSSSEIWTFISITTPVAIHGTREFLACLLECCAVLPNLHSLKGGVGFSFNCSARKVAFVKRTLWNVALACNNVAFSPKFRSILLHFLSQQCSFVWMQSWRTRIFLPKLRLWWWWRPL